MENRLVWLDLEMTGLNPERDVILEIATVVTDTSLNTVAEGPVFAIHHPPAVLESMDEWNTNQHGKSGLVKRVETSQETMDSAEAKTLEFLAGHVQPGTALLCGNSIWQDRRFLSRHMPRLEKLFHYRMVDVSSIKVLAQNWYPNLAPFPKSDKHLAMEDVHDSIGELRYYRENVFQPVGAKT